MGAAGLAGKRLQPSKNHGVPVLGSSQVVLLTRRPDPALLSLLEGLACKSLKEAMVEGSRKELSSHGHSLDTPV